MYNHNVRRKGQGKFLDQKTQHYLSLKPNKTMLCKVAKETHRAYLHVRKITYTYIATEDPLLSGSHKHISYKRMHFFIELEYCTSK